MSPEVVAVIRLLLALFLGALVGFERESHGRSAGLRTHALVGLAMSLLMVISLEIPRQFGAPDLLRADPGRLAQGALTGMGFIGAGVVLKGRGSIRGVTTAASLWTVSAIGLAVGVGDYLLGVVACVLAILILFALRSKGLENMLQRETFTRLQVSGPRLNERLATLEDTLRAHRADVLFVSMTHNLASGSMSYRFSLRFPARPDWKGLTEDVAKLPGIERLIWLQGLVP